MRKFKESRSGQVLIVAALAIALIISSTIVYVFQTGQVQSGERPFSADGFVRTVRLSSRNLVIWSLANISYGGANSTLRMNLERWCDFVEKQYYFGECVFSLELCNVSPYSSGLRVFWGQEGFGITSAKADFLMNLTDIGTRLSVVYSANVTTSLSVSAVSRWVPTQHLINVTIAVFDEGEPALAKNLTVYYETKKGKYENAGLLPDYLLKDFGNGTYRASFTVGPPRYESRGILVKCYDQREIYVEAGTVCIDI